MNAVNAVLLFILVWTFSAVCQADTNGCVSCDDVTGTVRKEVNFTCRFSDKCTGCCIKKYKFQYPEIYMYHDLTNCTEELFHSPCDQRNIFTCRYTPTKAMTEKFRLFVQADCGTFESEFTVDISEPLLRKEGESKDTGSRDTESKDTVISSVVGCFMIIILIIILMTIICKKHGFGFQKRMFLCIRHDEDNSDHPEDVINYSAV